MSENYTPIDAVVINVGRYKTDRMDQVTYLQRNLAFPSEPYCGADRAGDYDLTGFIERGSAHFISHYSFSCDRFGDYNQWSLPSPEEKLVNAYIIQQLFSEVIWHDRQLCSRIENPHAVKNVLEERLAEAIKIAGHDISHDVRKNLDFAVRDVGASNLFEEIYPHQEYDWHTSYYGYNNGLRFASGV